ncbi:MAG: methyltransferase domain-containing protein [Candidatus Omnitrophota bacterium]|nr:MAG: methyltransferase domain-containing protein [Candidatus Omnitrophota bacterium]
MKVKKDWWKNFFNEIYLTTDARSIFNTSLTQKEVNLLEDLLGLNKNERILDLCGGYGRHSLELAKRGYRDLTVLDYSDYQIKLGQRLAKQSYLDITFLCRDARASKLRGGTYSTVFIMANSFGYFLDDRQNIRILSEAHRLLQKGGKLLLDLVDPHYVKKKLKPLSWHEATKDVIVCRRRHMEGDVIKAREIVLCKRRGLLRDGLYCIRIYDKGKIKNLLGRVGFKGISIKKDISLHTRKKDYGFLTSRMIVTASKAKS